MYLYRNSELIGEFSTLDKSVTAMLDSEHMLDILEFSLLDNGERLFDLPFQEAETMEFWYTICDDGDLEHRVEPGVGPVYATIGTLLRAFRGDPDALKQIIGDKP